MVANDTDAGSQSAFKAKSENYTGRDNLPALGVSISLSQIAFSGKSILENFKLDLAPANLTCLLGPSGVGKTSILKTLAGLLPLSSGSSIEASDGQALSGRIAYMGQNDLLLPWASVMDNVLIGQRLKGEKPNFPKATDILAAVGLKKNLNDLPSTLSGGMRQRVALARTLMEDAPVILVDEPFSALDAITRHKLQALLCELTSDRTVLMITHDPMEALRMSDKIIVLSGSPAKPYQIEPLTSARPRELTDEGLKPRYEKIMALLDMSDKGAY